MGTSESSGGAAKRGETVVAKYAKVRFASPLPAIDKEFDYEVPDSLSLKFGHLVKVPFGKAGKEKIGIVVGISETTAFDNVLQINSLVSQNVFLNKNQLELINQVASRSCGSIGELLAQVIPKFMPRADKKWHHGSVDTREDLSETRRQAATKRFILARSGNTQGIPSWINTVCKSALETLRSGNSVIVAVPDFRDLGEIQKALNDLGVDQDVVAFNTEDSKTDHFEKYLAIQSKLAIILGLRSSVFLPARALASIIVVDDGDESHFEQSSPYWNTRDVALQRQNIESCDLFFISSSPSSEIIRLAEMGYLSTEVTEEANRIVRLTQERTRINDETWGAITKTIKDGKPVLVQVANLGIATAIACSGCSEIRRCECGAGIWIDPNSNFRCRNCKRTGNLAPCACGETKFRLVRTGSTFISESLAKSFGPDNVVHSTGAERIKSIERSGKIVIATPGAEPFVNLGYELVVIADAAGMLGTPRMRALEQSCLKWANAVQRSASGALIVFVGLDGDIGHSIKHLDFYNIVKTDTAERKELGLPPYRRLGTISSRSSIALELMKTELASLACPITLLPTATSSSFSFLYDYSVGSELSANIAMSAKRLTAKSKDRRPGERLYRVIMDDPSAI